MRIIVNYLIIASALLVEIFVVFFSQLYNPLFLWIVSYALVLFALIIGVTVNRRRLRVYITLMSSAVIGGNFLFNTRYAGGMAVMALYGGLIVLTNWALLLLITETARDISRRAAARSKGG